MLSLILKTLTILQKLTVSGNLSQRFTTHVISHASVSVFRGSQEAHRVPSEQHILSRLTHDFILFKTHKVMISFQVQTL